MPESDNKWRVLAERITEGILQSVDQAGKFEGRGSERHLTLGSVITKDGDVKSAQQVITDWVQREVEAALASEGGRG